MAAKTELPIPVRTDLAEKQAYVLDLSCPFLSLSPPQPPNHPLISYAPSSSPSNPRHNIYGGALSNPMYGGGLHGGAAPVAISPLRLTHARGSALMSGYTVMLSTAAAYAPAHGIENFTAAPLVGESAAHAEQPHTHARSIILIAPHQIGVQPAERWRDGHEWVEPGVS
ncbi:hypothetical protein B0H19DRAFT_1265286 [Mycena capillaripes]|nr:hypothetical protein B0H19DRAFT_1265286 [Mycena capillaripes]